MYEPKLETKGLIRPAGAGAMIHEVVVEGRPALLKDYSGNGTAFRLTCGAYMAHREAVAYRRLRDIDGVPHLLGRRGWDGILLAYESGPNCLDRASSDFTLEFFDQLRRLLAAVRGQGVLHGDVKRNVVAKSNGAPMLVDFGASFVIAWWLLPIRRLVISIGARYDERAIAKLKQRVAPQLVTPDDLELSATRLPFEALMHVGQRVLGWLGRWVMGAPDAVAAKR